MVEVPPTPEVAAAVFGPRLALAEAYVALLADTGIAHGLIGPREAPRLWDRHVLNSAVAAPVFDPDARVADIGSGAGLPGIPLAIVRPDLHVTLVEPLLRRTVWLTAAIDELGLTNVDVHRGRAESLWGETRFRHVTARAVARTGELARLTLPLLEARGSLHALKGGQADEELEADSAQLRITRRPTGGGSPGSGPASSTPRPSSSASRWMRPARSRVLLRGGERGRSRRSGRTRAGESRSGDDRS